MNSAPVVELVGERADDAGAPGPAPTEPAAAAIRFERGSRVYATDGPVGTLRQLVVDPATGTVEALVVRLDGKREAALTPPDLVDRSVGAALFLTISREQFALGASRTPRFDGRQFAKANLRALNQAIRRPAVGDSRRSIGWIGRDAVETRPALEPAAPAGAAAPTPETRTRRLFRGVPRPSA